MTAGYHALREGAALVDLPGRGHIRVTGEDRVRLLHAMCTNHVKQLASGQICYAFFLNAQGQIQADANILVMDDQILLDTEPEAADRLREHLDKFIIADDVTLEDLTGKVTAIGIEGPGAEAVMQQLGIENLPADALVSRRDMLAAGVSVTGAGYRFFLPPAGQGMVWDRFSGSGAIPATTGELEAVRVENARPRFPADLEGRIPHETRLMRAIHFDKGCYLGQEIVERVRSRGHVNRMLVQLALETETPPARGTALASNGEAAGEITSAVYSPAWGKVAALGYVKAAAGTAGTRLEAGGAAAGVTALVPG